MNTKVLSLALLGTALSFTACKKETEKIETMTEVTDTTAVAEPATDTTTAAADASVSQENKMITITGKVTEINQGKDGYTAKLKAEDGKTYSATISILNLADAKQYRAVKVGDNITVTGEPTAIEEDVLIKVTELQP